MLRKGVVGVGVVTVLGGGALYAYRERLRGNAAVSVEQVLQAQGGRDLVVARVARALELNSPAHPATLYRYATCPFCTKAQVALEFYGVEYRVAEVDPLLRQALSSLRELQLPHFRKVPQLLLGPPPSSAATAGSQLEQPPLLVDSELIVDVLEEVAGPRRRPRPPRSEDDKAAERQWRTWASSSLVRLLVVNTNRTLLEANQGYEYAEQVSSFSRPIKTMLKLVGGPIMYSVSRFVTTAKLEKLGVCTRDELRSDPRDPLFREVAKWARVLDERGGMHGGAVPDLADLDVYGVLVSVRDFSVFDEMLQHSPVLRPWIESMDRWTCVERRRSPLPATPSA